MGHDIYSTVPGTGDLLLTDSRLLPIHIGTPGVDRVTQCVAADRVSQSVAADRISKSVAADRKPQSVHAYFLWKNT